MKWLVFALVLLTLFCGFEAVREFRRGAIVVATLAALLSVVGVTALLRPVPTHAVKVETGQD